MTTILKSVSNSTPEELTNLAEAVRELADDIENGKVIAMAWAVLKPENKYHYEWVKARGVSCLEVSGVIHEFAAYMDHLKITEDAGSA